MTYFKDIQTKWADMDANGHLKNTAFSEFCTHVRFAFFAENGFNMVNLQQLKIGPVILREEAIYLREVHLLETVKVTCELLESTKDYAKFVFVQHIFKENGKKAARLIIEGLWLDLVKRKPISPPEILRKVCEKVPKAENWQLMEQSTVKRYL